MKKPETPANETARVAALCGLAVLDTPAEERFDRITRIAQRHFQVSIALVSLVDAERQWFKSCQGLGASETPRDISFCGHAILSEDILYIPNALDDPRFADNPLVTGAPNIRFYAGAPLHAPGGERVGTLCIIDDKPRTFSAAELTVLRDLANCVEVELERTHIIEAAHEAHRFQQILDKARDMIFMFDVDTLQFVYLNQGAVQSMGYTREALLQLHPYDIKPQIPEPAFRQLIAPLLSGEREALQFETLHRRKDGVDFPVEIYLQLVREAEDVGRFVAIVRDIGARKQAEAELRAVTAMRQAILDSANFSIIATDTEGVISAFNKGAQRMLGYTEAEMVGKHTPAILHLPDEVAAQALALSAELGKPVEPGFEVFVARTRDGRADEKEWTYVRTDGSTFPVLLSVTALFDDAGKIYGYLGIGSDLTERKHVDKMKREFISTVSHELRTPLTSIRGALGLMAGGATGALPDKAKELVKIASNNCDRLVRLINDILDMEKMESGKIAFDMLPVDLRALVEEAIAANQAYAAQHRVKIAVEGELPPAEIVGDHDRLIQVLTNLLSNAAKFTSPGGTVHVSLAETPDGVMLRVRDEGPGIPEEFQPRIFQKFSQADSSDTRSKGGSGLGLSIAKTIVEHHGGQIGFETVAGQGASFWVSLPAQQAAEAGEHQPGQVRVLVVEDDQEVAKLLRLILEDEGYAVDVAYNLAQARERLDAGRYAAMTLDLLLPGESGMSFVRELRERPESVLLPIVMVSAVVEHGRKELNGAAVSVLDWLEKPIDEERLLKAVAEAVKVSGGKRRVLHVEDDADIARILSAMLEGVAEVELASTLKQAHACLDSNDYALVILDISLPDGSGLGLLPRLGQIRPPIPILVFSAQELNLHDSQQGSATFMKSRTDIDSLVRVIRTNLAACDKDFVK
ncbi:MAG: PAS domain S-box protein [Pseudomonadota bacterium]